MALQELTIKNFALIKFSEIEFEEGLNAVTGETGAGKSLLLDALNLALGSRAEAGLIRHGETQCEVVASFDIRQLPEINHWLQLRELETEDEPGYCMLRRVVRLNKPTKCYINDHPTTLATLKELGLMLVDMHGQHEHQSLLQKSTQREIVDSFAGHEDDVAKIGILAKEIKSLEASLASLASDQSNVQERLDFVAFQLTELKEAQLQANEFAELEREFGLLSNSDDLKNGVAESLSVLFEREEFNVSSELGSLSTRLEKLASLDTNIDNAADLITSALAQVEESKVELSYALARIDNDPQRLAEIESRRDLIINLARKHRCAEDDLVQKQVDLQTEYDQLIEHDAKPESLQKKLAAQKSVYSKLADQLSLGRTRAAKALSERITAQMQTLGMQGGQFLVDISRVSDVSSFAAFGEDNVEFMVTANSGLPVKALSKTASGGELSRISLAIQVIASEKSVAPTLVFDEVDVGVGGAVAEIVGERLKELGQQAQILCITHQAQVAARGDHHFKVGKSVSADSAVSQITALNKEQRIAELARMMGGTELTEPTLLHAKDLLQSASAA